MGVAGRRDRRRDIVDAAFRHFARYGFRRASMNGIANEAGISRAALYLHFDGKEALFRALVDQLHREGMAEAEAAAASKASLEARVLALLEAKSLRLFDALRSSEHASEFLDENHRLCGDLSTRAAQRYAKLLTRTLARAEAKGELRLALGAGAAAELLLDCAEGVKSRALTSLTSAQLRRRLAELVRVVLAGLRGPEGGAKAARAPGGRRG